MSRSNEVSLRLSVKGREELLKTMKDMGGEFERAAKKVEAGSRQANAGIKSVNMAAKEAKGGLEGMASQGGIAGRVLKDLGPIGLAAGAGIGAMTAALGAALKISREAVKAFDQLGKGADNLRISTDLYQALKAAAADEGVEFNKVEAAIRKVDKAHSDLIQGKGELLTRLKDVNPQLVEMMRNTSSNEERLRILTTALQGATSETERANIAYAAFGEGGLEIARMLERQKGGLDEMISTYREMGLVVREDVIRNAEDMETKFGQAAQIVDLQLKQAFIDLAPVLLRTAQLMADVASGIADILDKSRELGDRSEKTISDRLDWMEDVGRKTYGLRDDELEEARATGRRLERRKGWEVSFNAWQNNYQKIAAEERKRIATRAEKELINELRQLSVEELRRRRADLEKQLAEQEALIQKVDTRPAALTAAAGIRQEIDRVDAVLAQPEVKPNARDPQKEADDKARLAEYNRLRTEAIALQKQLGDYTIFLAEATARYNQMREAGLITDEQYAQAVKTLTDELSGAKAATDLWVGVVEAARSPAEVLSDKMAQLDEDYAKGKISIDLYRKAMEELVGLLAEAEQQEREKAPGFKAAEAIRAELEKATFEALSPAEKLRKETERIRELVASGDLSDTAATEWLDLYAKRLDEAAQKTGVLAAAERVLDDIQNGRIRTMDDLKVAFSAMLIGMVRDYLAAQQTMSGGGGFLSFLFGGDGQKGWFNFGGGDGGNVGASHSGGWGGRSPQTRRLGSGTLPGEHLTVVRDDERVVTPAGQMRIESLISQMAAERAAMAGLVTRAAESSAPAGGPPGLKVIINNHAGAEVQTSMRETPDGPEMSIDIAGKLGELVEGGSLDGPMRRRYGLRAAS